MLPLFLFLQVSYAECNEAISNKEFDDRLDNLSMGFIEGNMGAIEESLTLSNSYIPCLSEQVQPETAQKYHVLSGLYYWLQRDFSIAESHLSLAKQIDSSKGIPIHLFPEGHAVHEYYGNLAEADLAWLKKAPAVGSFYFDGRYIPQRPKNAHTIFQIIDGDVVLLSALVAPDDELPEITSAIKEGNNSSEENNTETDSQKETTKEENSAAEKSTFRYKKTATLGAISILSFAGMSYTGSQFYALEGDNGDGIANNHEGLYYGNLALLGTSILSTTGTIIMWNKERKAE